MNAIAATMPERTSGTFRGLAAMQSEQADCEHLPANAEAVPAGDLVCYDEVAADARDIELGSRSDRDYGHIGRFVVRVVPLAI